MVVAVILIATTWLPAMAEEFPARPIRIIAPTSAGGATDIIVRAMGPRMSAVSGGSLVVENVAGAGGIVGTDAISRATPDGYTIGVATAAALSANPHLHKQLPYDAAKGFEPICRIGVGPYVLVVHPSLGVKTVAELLTRVKSERLTFASPGVGSAAHMAQELFKSRVGAKNFTHVPYKGTSQAVTDTVAGHTQVLFEAPGPLLPYLRSSQLIPLAITSSRRIASLPDVPTLVELGYKDLQWEGWIGLVAPAGTPKPIVERFAKACDAALAAPDFKVQAQSLGFEVSHLGPADFKAFMANELVKWGDAVRLAGLKAE